MSGCPVGDDISICPLYIESHNAQGLGCVDDMSRPCMVMRGEMNFQKSLLMLAAMGIDHPGLLQAITTIGGRQ